VDQVQKLERVEVTGLMSMAAYSPDPENARPAFIRLRKLGDELRARCDEKNQVATRAPVDGHDRRLRSRDREGATIVRIGSALCPPDGLS